MEENIENGTVQDHHYYHDDQDLHDHHDHQALKIENGKVVVVGLAGSGSRRDLFFLKLTHSHQHHHHQGFHQHHHQYHHGSRHYHQYFHHQRHCHQKHHHHHRHQRNHPHFNDGNQGWCQKSVLHTLSNNLFLAHMVSDGKSVLTHR